MGGHYMWGMVNRFCIVFLDADWYRYLWIFKGFTRAYFAAFWQDCQGLKLIKFSSKSLDITTLPETDLFSMNLHPGDI
jgi:hypothetical protein